MQNQVANPVEAHEHTVEWTAALAKKAVQGDRAAFDKLINLFWPDIYRMVYFRAKNPMDAEDLAQEVFLRAYAGLERLRQPESFRSWLFSIALNLVRDFYRRSRGLRLVNSAAFAFSLMFTLAAPALAWRVRVLPGAVARWPALVVRPAPVVVRPAPICPQGWYWNSCSGRCGPNN